MFETSNLDNETKKSSSQAEQKLYFLLFSLLSSAFILFSLFFNRRNQLIISFSIILLIVALTYSIMIEINALNSSEGLRLFPFFLFSTLFVVIAHFCIIVLCYILKVNKAFFYVFSAVSFLFFASSILIFLLYFHRNPGFSKTQFFIEKRNAEKKHINWSRMLPVLVNIVGSVVTIVTSFLMAKMLGGDSYGTLQYYLGIVNTMSFVLSFGLTNYLTKNAQFATDKNSFFSKYIFWVFVMSILVFPLYFLVAFFGLSKLNRDIWLISLIYIAGFLFSLSTTIAAFLNGINKRTISSLLSGLIPRAVIFLVFLIFLLLHKTDTFVSFYLELFALLYLVLSIPSLIKRFKKTNLKVEKAEFASIAFFYGITLTTSITSQLSKIIQGQASLTNMSSVGALSISFQIMTVSAVFTTSIISVFAPDFSSLAHSRKFDELASLFMSILRLWSYIIVPFGCGVAIQSKFLLSLMGDEYKQYWLILVFIDLSYFFDDVTGPCGALLNMSGNEKDELFNGFINLAVFSVFAFSLSKYFYWGIAFAFLASIVVQKLVRFFQIKRRLGFFPLSLKSMLMVLINSAISCAVFFVISIVDTIWLKIVLDCLAGTGLIVGFFFLSPFKNDKKIFAANKADNKDTPINTIVL